MIGVGCFTTLHQIGNKIKLQIELDQLTGTVAIQLRASIITLEQSKERLRIAHAAMLVGCVYLPSCPAFEHAFELQQKVEEAIQKIAEENWELQKLSWLRFAPITSQKSELPSLDDLSGVEQTKIKIQLKGLISASKLWKKERGSNEWKVAWIE